MRRSLPGEFGDLLANATFVRLFAGRVVTDAGDSFYYIGTMWLVWELTTSPLFTGIAGALVQVPNALRFLVGPLVDRWRLRRVLLGTQVVNAVGVLVVPLAAATGRLSVWVVLALIPALNVVNNFVYPAQNAALPRIVRDDQLTRANSLFSTTISTVDMVANAIAGGLIAAVGAVALYVVDAATFAAAALLFAGIAVPTADETDDGSGATDDAGGDGASDDPEDAAASSDPGAGYLAELRGGFAYVRGSVLRAIVVCGMVANFVFYGVNAVLPAFADSFAGAAAYGLLLAATGAGTLLGSAGAVLVDDYPFGRIATVGYTVAGLLWLLAIALPGLWPTVGLLVAAVVPVGAFNVMLGTMVQSAVDTDYLGRVSALLTSAFNLMMPAGALVGGAAAGVVGSRTVMYASGGALLVLAALFMAHPGLRSLPAVTDVDETALGLGSASGYERERAEDPSSTD